jgi:UTP--glucose-1-phosphate uridylyltransferase
VSDHLYISRLPRRCAEQLVEVAVAEQCSVSAVQPTRESMLPYYGAVGGSQVGGRTGLYQIERVLEKPTPTKAEQELAVPGLRAGHYLCLFGMHVFTPTVMELLARHVEGDGAARHGQPLILSPALAELAKRERYLAFELEGTRFNIGMKYGMLVAQLALALHGSDREEILARMVELLAARYHGVT